MQGLEQWWLVITRPLDETKDAEHPVLNRNDDSRA
jgi:hypothetical protein